MKNYMIGTYWFFGASVLIAIVYLSILRSVWKPKQKVKRRKNRKHKKARNDRVNTVAEA